MDFGDIASPGGGKPWISVTLPLPGGAMSPKSMVSTPRERQCHRNPWFPPPGRGNVTEIHGFHPPGEAMSPKSMVSTPRGRQCHRNPWFPPPGGGNVTEIHGFPPYRRATNQAAVPPVSF